MLNSLIDFIGSLFTYNTKLVALSTFLLGISAGPLGTFLTLRKKALISDAISHATLPGIGLAMMLAPASLIAHYKFPILIFGALMSSLIAVAAIQFFAKRTKLDNNTIIGVILSSFFGFGLIFLSHIQYADAGNQTGITHFIFGQAASIQRYEAFFIFGLASIILCLTALFYRAFKLISFDSEFARSIGFSFSKYDFILIFMITVIMMIGLQTVGILLIVALLLIPAAAARLWSHHLVVILMLSSLFGGISALSGTFLSAKYEDMPTGATIVLTATSFFALSFIIKKLIPSLLYKTAGMPK